MGAFEFMALDAMGHNQKGVLEGDNPRQIRQQIRDKGWTPLNVEEVRQRQKTRELRSIKIRRGVSTTDLAVVTRQLATLIGAGSPIDESLGAVSRQTDKPALKSIMLAVRSRVTEGHSLAESMGDFPRVFPELYRATVSAGEQSGHLNVVLDRLADYTEGRQELGSQIKLALIYPVILVVVAFGISGFLLTTIVPEIVKTFSNFGQELPLMTRVLIVLSDFLVEYGLLILGSAVIVGIGFKVSLRNEAFRKRVDMFVLSLPLVSQLIRGMNAARFARTFSILTASGVPVLDGLRISAEVMSNLIMRTAVQEATDRVREGASLNRALDKSGQFPPLTIHLIASGEASGKLEEMLERAAVSQERELQMISSAMIKIMEPVLILTMAAVVMFIVLAILMPIFDMNQLVR